MNRYGIFALVSILAFSMSASPALAQAQTGDGIDPDNFFYGFDVFLDNIMLAFASGDIEKAELSLAIAEERLQEVRLMIEKNKLSAAQVAQSEHDKILSVAEDAIGQIESENALDELKEEVEIEKKLNEHKTSNRKAPVCTFMSLSREIL